MAFEPLQITRTTRPTPNFSPLRDDEEKVSAKKAFTKAAAFSAAPTLAGIAGGIKTGAVVGTLTGGPIGTVLGALGGGFVAATLTSKAQAKALEIVNGKEWVAKQEEELAQNRKDRPLATFAGEVVPQLATAKFSPQTVVRSTRLAQQILTNPKNASTLIKTPAGKAAFDDLINVSVGGGVEVGAETYRQAQEGDFNALRLIAAGTVGTLINQPNKFGMKIGMKPSGEMDVTPDIVKPTPSFEPLDAPRSVDVPVEAPQTSQNAPQQAVRGGDELDSTIGKLEIIEGTPTVGNKSGFGLSKIMGDHPDVLPFIPEALTAAKVVEKLNNRDILEAVVGGKTIRMIVDHQLGTDGGIVKKTFLNNAYFKDVPRGGIEPPTSGVSNLRSASELPGPTDSILTTKQKSSQGVDSAASPDLASQKFSSRVYERMQAENPEVLTGNVEATRVNLKQDADRAVDLITTDKQRAFKVAMGAESSPDVTSTSVNIALAEKALDEGNTALYAQLIKNRSLEQTRRGQEIVAERGSISDNSTSKYVKELIASRLDKLGDNYLTNLKEVGRKRMSKKGRGIEALDKQVKDAQTKVAKTRELDLLEAQSIIDKLTC